MVNEVVTNYSPSLIWFDFGLRETVTEKYQKQMFADYYNWSHNNDVEGGVVHKHAEIRKHMGMLDFERGRADSLTAFPWMTDTSIGPWFHQQSHGYKSVNQLIDIMFDIVSKNGVLLLNVGPKADGTIPDSARHILMEMGDWLEMNGEAIYETRPWITYGEGPSKMDDSGKFSEKNPVKYTAEDIRYTRSKDGSVLYAILLGWPGSNNQVTLEALAKDNIQGDFEINEVSMVGSSETIDWEWQERGLMVNVPSKKVDEKAVVFKIAKEGEAKLALD